MTAPAAIGLALVASVWLLGTVGVIAWTLDALVTERRIPWRRALAALASTAAGLAVFILLAAGR